MRGRLRPHLCPSDGERPEVSAAAALAAWGRVEVLGRLAGGIRNEVLLVDVDGRSRVARVGRRARDDLEWELDLLTALNAAGIPVPTIVPALDGRRHVAGLVVMEFIDGRPPGSTREWRAVADYLRRVHALGVGWSQRPGWASSIDLLTREKSPVVDLAAMPPESVQRCRRAWRRLADAGLTVVHGDPNDRNVRITNEGVVLLDWDEARLDVPALDLAAVPGRACPLRGRDRWAAEQALHSWEAAACWAADPLYARRRLDQVEFVQPGPRGDLEHPEAHPVAGHRSPCPAMRESAVAPTRQRTS